MVGRHRTGTVVAVLLLAGCSTGADEPASAPTMPAPSSAAPSPGPTAHDSPQPASTSEATPAATGTAGTDGISVEEASELGVLTGDYDALLDGPVAARERDGCVVVDVELRNVGAADDLYDVEATPVDVTVEPTTVAVAPGDLAVLEVTICADEPVVLTATSRGRDEAVAELEFHS